MSFVLTFLNEKKTKHNTKQHNKIQKKTQHKTQKTQHNETQKKPQHKKNNKTPQQNKSTTQQNTHKNQSKTKKTFIQIAYNRKSIYLVKMYKIKTKKLHTYFIYACNFFVLISYILTK